MVLEWCKIHRFDLLGRGRDRLRRIADLVAGKGTVFCIDTLCVERVDRLARHTVVGALLPADVEALERLIGLPTPVEQNCNCRVAALHTMATPLPRLAHC